MKKHTLLYCLLIILFSCGGKKLKHPVLLNQVENINSLKIENVTIFNGVDSTLIMNQDVWIENGRIKEIDLTKNLLTPINIKTIDGTGKTLMPGIIDAHVHISGSGSVPWAPVRPDIDYNLTAYLYAGITTVYDLGGLASKSKKYSRNVEANKIPGPSIFFTHIPITVKGSHPIPLAKLTAPFPLNKLVEKISPVINHIDDASIIISNYKKMEVDYIKLVCDQLPPGTPEMSYDLMKALITEAHKQGYKVIAHIGSSKNAIDAVDAGADVLAHGIYRGEISIEEAEFIASKKVPMIYTLAGFENVFKICTGQFIPGKFDSLLMPPQILKPVTGELGKEFLNTEIMGEFGQEVIDNRKFWKTNFKTLKKAGVKIIVGTDSSLPGTYSGATFYQEILMLKEYGLSNFEILTGATSLSANLFLTNPDFGIIEKGKKADLLLLNGNPLLDLKYIMNPSLILKHGNIIHRNK